MASTGSAKAQQWCALIAQQLTTTAEAQRRLHRVHTTRKSMTDKHFDDSTREMRLHLDEFTNLWVKARLISVGGLLHQFVPKEPGWCQVLGNKVDLLVCKQMSIRPWDKGRTLAALQKHVERLNYVYSIAEARRQAHLAKRRLRRQQGKGCSNKPMSPSSLAPASPKVRHD
jgi:hypothetical protein